MDLEFLTCFFAVSEFRLEFGHSAHGDRRTISPTKNDKLKRLSLPGGTDAARLLDLYITSVPCHKNQLYIILGMSLISPYYNNNDLVENIGHAIRL